MQNTIRGTSTKDERLVGGTESYFDNDGPGPRIMAASTLDGDKVVNGAGEDLGDIKDIMIDVPSGRVALCGSFIRWNSWRRQQVVRGAVACVTTGPGKPSLHSQRR